MESCLKKEMTLNAKNRHLSRKVDHLRFTRELPDGPISTGFEDINLIHYAISPLDIEQIDASSLLFGKRLAAPILINAMTGGPEESGNINRQLSLLAKELGLGMAVGSQRLALEYPELKGSYTVARKVNPHGLILANLSALAPQSHVLAAVEMLEADGIQLHLNIAQELMMAEGDRNFQSILDNIAEIIQMSPVPVIVKEVGFGISRETALELWDRGLKYLDVGGQGGTNFAAIERHRLANQETSVFEEWGIPTAISLAEVSSLSIPLIIFATGGIRTSLDVAKSIALGADFATIAGPLVKKLTNQTKEELLEYYRNFIYEFRCLMLLTGSCALTELKSVPIIFRGKTKDWLEQRGILDYYQTRIS